MSVADKKYKELILDIYNNGTWDTDKEVRAKYEDGTPAYSKSVFGRQIVFEENELPLVTCKKVYWQAAIKETDLFWIRQSSSQQDFDDVKLGFWKQWINKDGNLGTAYPYQLKRPSGENQVIDLINNLISNPASKRHLVSFFNYDERKLKALQECCWAFQFFVRENKLDMILMQRSVDLMLGFCANGPEYKALQMLLAHCVGLKPGRFIWQMGVLHYYDRHEKDALAVLDLTEYEQPNLILDTSKGTDFFSYSWEDFKLENYQHGPFIPFEVAI